MAGTVEVYEVTEWGSDFVSPIGENIISDLDDPFQRTFLFVMAQVDGTNVTLTRFGGGVESVILNQGESAFFDEIDPGDRVTTQGAGFPIQVDIVAGDLAASYEMRWYALLPLSDWSNDYW